MLLSHPLQKVSALVHLLLSSPGCAVSMPVRVGRGRMVLKEEKCERPCVFHNAPQMMSPP